MTMVELIEWSFLVGIEVKICDDVFGWCDECLRCGAVFVWPWFLLGGPGRWWRRRPSARKMFDEAGLTEICDDAWSRIEAFYLSWNNVFFIGSEKLKRVFGCGKLLASTYSIFPRTNKNPSTNMFTTVRNEPTKHCIMWSDFRPPHLVEKADVEHMYYMGLSELMSSNHLTPMLTIN